MRRSTVRTRVVVIPPGKFWRRLEGIRKGTTGNAWTHLHWVRTARGSTERQLLMAREGSIRSLRSRIGEMIIVRTPAIDEFEMKLVRLHGIEPNGIWIESQDFTETMMKKCKLATSTTTLLLFLPFHNIDFIVGSIRAVSLSEEGLGI